MGTDPFILGDSGTARQTFEESGFLDGVTSLTNAVPVVQWIPPTNQVLRQLAVATIGVNAPIAVGTITFVLAARNLDTNATRVIAQVVLDPNHSDQVQLIDEAAGAVGPRDVVGIVVIGGNTLVAAHFVIATASGQWNP